MVGERLKNDDKQSLRESAKAAKTEEELAEIGAKLGGKWVAKTLAEVAEFAGVTQHTAKAYRTEKPPLPGKPGAYPLDEIFQWAVNRARRDSGYTKSDAARRREEADADVKREHARRLKRENAFAEGDLISKSDNQRELSVINTTIRDHFLGMPERVCASMPPSERDFIREELLRQVEADLIMLDDRFKEMGA